MKDGMKPGITLVFILVCTVVFVTSGCIGQQQAQTPVVTATPASPATTPPPNTPTPLGTGTTHTEAITASATESLPEVVLQPPPQYAVDVRIDKDRVYSTITVTFAGGPGQVFVDKILVRVTRSDGLKEEKEIPFKDQIPVGASVDLAGTKGSDRVEVYATINGVIYKIKDQNAVYEQY